jgi:hypothetical protein
VRCKKAATHVDVMCSLHSDPAEVHWLDEAKLLCQRLFTEAGACCHTTVTPRCCMAVAKSDADMGYCLPALCGLPTLSVEQVLQEDQDRFSPLRWGTQLVFCQAHALEVAAERGRTKQQWGFEEAVGEAIAYHTGMVLA